MSRPANRQPADGAAPSDGFAPAELAAWFGFLETHKRVVRDIDAALQGTHGIPLTQFDVLLQLRLHGGKMRMAELAEARMLSRSGLTRVVDQLEKRGFVTREPDPDDGRGLYVTLTSSGGAVLRSASSAHVANVRRRFLAALDDDQLRQLTLCWRAIAADITDVGAVSSVASRS